MIALTWLGVAVMTAGVVFLALGGLGLVRMPDTYTRIQAGTKATTLGTILSLFGAALIMPGWSIKLLLIALFLMFTNPLSSQVLARAAHRAGVPATDKTKADALADDQEGLA
ncbi:monovalent cation/H(+) antiporter subunit G [Tropicimonas isoalkanivorans]|uniref:Multicomponent Na+:H+ antiporter subunit G n=1 Tax=Tropicimonas isoalkanivorans TaxID=441112 RepID=A0A1I1HGQ1_9RHOB|nr:monovalent cation/H(+) antiporter subunit G [Tropicimonas isoalkanivorans]SFC23124.1 multicomponent Na+:H+ antiporter subunit G [Tropicimonas isoalkanivorans]